MNSDERQREGDRQRELGAVGGVVVAAACESANGGLALALVPSAFALLGAATNDKAQWAPLHPAVEEVVRRAALPHLRIAQGEAAGQGGGDERRGRLAARLSAGRGAAQGSSRARPKYLVQATRLSSAPKGSAATAEALRLRDASSNTMTSSMSPSRT